jgi:lipopolysaccharide/colanic/teichoic acid biosynthesis glycosyltransferase
LTSLPSESQWAKDMEVLSKRSVNAARRIHLILKRAFDFVASLLALVVLAIPMLVVAVILKLDSAGPVFFAHRREGRNGKEFPCVKFRTMTADAHRLQRKLYEANEVDGPQFKLKNDPRITRLGRLLRATNFDEIPQLFNVLVGHMSLVGPRPSPFRENQICVPWRQARLSVRPGITGLWQVCRDENRTEGDFHEWIYYDIEYVRGFSFWLDLRILVATVFALTGWRGLLRYLLPAGSRSSTFAVPRLRGGWTRRAGASPA